MGRDIFGSCTLHIYYKSYLASYFGDLAFGVDLISPESFWPLVEENSLIKVSDLLRAASGLLGEVTDKHR